MHVILNHKFKLSNKATISARDRGFRYGDGAFETIAVHDGIPYRLNWHLKRLAQGLKAIRISYPASSLAKECRGLIKKNKMKDGLLRIQVTRGMGGRGYLPDAKAKPTCVIETLPLPKIPGKPISLWLSSYRRISGEALPVRYKLCQGLNSTLARMEAADHKCFDALLLNARGEMCETSSANIFWIKNNTLYTPSLACGAVEGATRDAIITLSPYPVKEARAGLGALKHADAVFIANAAWKILPVDTLKPRGGRWNSAAQARIFQQLLEDDINVSLRRRGADREARRAKAAAR